MKLSEMAKATQIKTESIKNGKVKVETSDIIEAGKSITITGAELSHSDNGDFSVWTYAEDPGVFFFGGKVLTDILKMWIDSKGSLEAVNKSLAEELPMIMLSREKSQTTRNYYTAVTFID